MTHSAKACIRLSATFFCIPHALHTSDHLAARAWPAFLYFINLPPANQFLCEAWGICDSLQVHLLMTGVPHDDLYKP